MAGLCSRHHPSLGKVEGCAACHGTMKDLFPDYWVKHIAAKVSGQHRCKHCGFKSYNTGMICPKPGCRRRKPKMIIFMVKIAAVTAIFLGILHIVKIGWQSLVEPKQEDDGSK